MNNLVEFIIENEEFNILNNEMTLFHKDDNDKIIKCYKSFDNINSIIGENLNIVKISKQFWLNFKNLNYINLSQNKIFKFSKNFFDLSNLLKLNVNHNSIINIPSKISQLTSLKYLSINNNKIELIPNALIKLTNLTYLDISYNKIEDLPIELGLMKSLNTLKIIGNKIEKLPTTLCQLTNLKEIEFEWFKFIDKNNIQFIYKTFRDLFNNTQLYCTFIEFMNKVNKDKDVDYSSILYSSIDNNYVGLIKILCENSNTFNIILEKKYKDKKPPFYYSLTESKNEEIINTIFNNLKINILSKNEKFSYLTKLIRLKNIRLIKKILDKIEDENDLVNDSEMTPFHYIFSNFNSEIAKSKIIGNLFFSKCSNNILNHISNEGWGAIHVAIRRGSLSCIKWIINMNDKNKNNKIFLLNLKGKDNWTPLHLSTNSNNIEITKLLLENNCDVFNRTNSNKTPKDFSYKNPPNEITKLLFFQEEKMLDLKYNKDEEKCINKKKIISYNISRANINFYKEILINRDSSLFEICDAINNLTFALLTPLIKKYSNEDFANFVEKTISSFDLSLNNKKNYLCISSFSNLAICLKAIQIQNIYSEILQKEKVCDIIKNDMLNCIQILNQFNINNNNNNTNSIKNKKNNPNKRNKKRIVNIINLKNSKKLNKSNSSEEFNDSLDNNSKKENINFDIKNQRTITNLSNESCNILDSSASISQASIGMTQLNLNKNK